MKKKIIVMGIAALLTTTGLMAQGGFQRKTVEERVKEVKEKLVDFKLDADKSAKTDSAFATFYRESQKMMEEAMASGGQVDREAMRANRQKLSDERDAKLKLIFTEEQFKKWKDEIEPSMRPQRGQRGGGR
jgi:hypothetical protein